MPMATAKWQKQCARRSTEQREKAKARLLGKPAMPMVFPEPPPDDTTSGQFNGPIYTYAATDMVINDQRIAAGQYLPQGQYRVVPVQMYGRGFDPYPLNVQSPYNITYTYQNTIGANLMAMSQAAQDAWNTWSTNIQTIGTTAQTLTGTWTQWNNQLGAGGGMSSLGGGAARALGGGGGGYGGYQPTPEQRAASERAHAERQRIHAKAAEERQEAHARALELFLHVLRPDERASYEREKCIYVNGSRGRRYRIRCGTSQSHNVEWIDDKGTKLATLCAHPREAVPNPDCWMVQKLTLEHDEDHFIGMANYNGQRPAELVTARR